MTNRPRRPGERLLDLLFPPKCAFCGRLLGPEEDGICTRCVQSLPWNGTAPRKLDFTTGAAAPLFYEGQVRQAMLRYKFNGAPARGAVFGRLIAEDLRKRNLLDFDVVTWAPLSSRRLRRRGYDQARLLASSAAEALGMEARPLLKKIRQNRTQSGIASAEERRANVSGCYAVTDPALAEGRRILLIDDIITSGATVSECARMLMLAGAGSVQAASLAIRRREKDKLEPHEVTDI